YFTSVVDQGWMFLRVDSSRQSILVRNEYIRQLQGPNKSMKGLGKELIKGEDISDIERSLSSVISETWISNSIIRLVQGQLPMVTIPIPSMKKMALVQIRYLAMLAYVSYIVNYRKHLFLLIRYVSSIQLLSSGEVQVPTINYEMLLGYTIHLKLWIRFFDIELGITPLISS